MNIRYLPTTPLEFARPFGKWLDADKRSSRGVSEPLQHSTTARARWNCSFLFSSKYVAPVTRPFLSTSIRRTWLLGRTSHRPVASAIGMTVYSVDDLARNSQPKPRQ